MPPNYDGNFKGIRFILTKDFLNLKHDQKQIQLIVRKYFFFQHIPFLPIN